MPRVRLKDIPYGTCQCGCGGTTKIIGDHRPGRGLVKGEPYKLLRGHKVERPFIPPYATRVQAGEVWRLPVRKIGGGHVFALVDAGLWPGVGVHRWRLDRDGYPTRGVKAGEAQDGSCVRLHRYVLGLALGDDQVDHINRDKLDNRRANLRLADSFVQARNRDAKLSASGHRGVYWHEASKRWMVICSKDGRHHYLGVYTDLDEAAAVAREWRRENLPWLEEYGLAA